MYVVLSLQDGGGDTSEGTESDGDTPFLRLKDGLECARTLIGCLKREKWRLSKRQMSVELRMGELEDYKSHLKQDMVRSDHTQVYTSTRYTVNIFTVIPETGHGTQQCSLRVNISILHIINCLLIHTRVSPT
jgi:hypothetical protein